MRMSNNLGRYLLTGALAVTGAAGCGPQNYPPVDRTIDVARAVIAQSVRGKGTCGDLFERLGEDMGGLQMQQVSDSPSTRVWKSGPVVADVKITDPDGNPTRNVVANVGRDDVDPNSPASMIAGSLTAKIFAVCTETMVEGEATISATPGFGKIAVESMGGNTGCIATALSAEARVQDEFGDSVVQLRDLDNNKITLTGDSGQSSCIITVSGKNPANFYRDVQVEIFGTQNGPNTFRGGILGRCVMEGL